MVMCGVLNLSQLLYKNSVLDFEKTQKTKDLLSLLHGGRGGRKNETRFQFDAR